MCSTASTLSLCLPSTIPVLSRRRLNFTFTGNPLYFRPRKPRHLLSASVSEKYSTGEVSWISSDKTALDDYNGWAIADYPPHPVEKKGLVTSVAFGVGASLAAAIGLLAYISLSRKGFKFCLRKPFSILHGYLVPYSTVTDGATSEEVDALFDDTRVPKENLDDDVLDSPMAADTRLQTLREQKFERIIVPFTVDAAQQEALLALKTLNIIEDDVKADDLCTRREYARWLVQTNSHLERSRKHRLSTPCALSGSTITAFDDVGIEDPDFRSIQSLAEAGIVRSKLSDRHSISKLNVGKEEGFMFLPERFITRQDLISWKAKIEYEEVMPGINEEVSRKKTGFLDVKDISSDALAEVFVDVVADEKSIIRRVFGQCKRLQPSKPCTKGQAAVAITSGRMTEFIYSEILRLKAEEISRQTELKELTSEFLERGEMKQDWERKMEDEKNRGLQVEISYREAVDDFGREKVFQENALAEIMKQKAALDCQKKILCGLKAEIADMSKNLSSEKEKYVVEEVEVKDTRHDLQVILKGSLDKKSILEAEIEALKILRSWVEDEARKSQARAKLLEEACRRWKWDS